MQITTLRLRNFQSFGPTPIEISLNKLTYVLGPNGSGKTTVLLALARLFSPVPALRRVQPEDFHIPPGVDPEQAAKELWLEVDIEFAEAADEDPNPSVPPFFTHMALKDPRGVPTVRIRLTAALDVDGYVDEKIEFITQVDPSGEPKKRSDMSRHDRGAIEVHYVPARRDPIDHISYTTASLLGRMLRSADWTGERTELARLTDAITATMVSNDAITNIGDELVDAWSGLHKGDYFKNPAIAFGRGDIEGVLRQLTVSFAPAPTGGAVSFERLSDGEKSLLYISLVLAWQGLAVKVLSGKNTAFDRDRLRPPVHIVLALEEPENSLAPQYLGRIVRQIRNTCYQGNAQGVVATHAPAVLHRVEPEDIRFLRLGTDRATTVRTIAMPPKADDAAKYVREAIRAYPELYFARLVILGEGDSEQIVLPRLLAALGIADDDASVSVVPLGGRHVNHFWRLLEQLDIPYVTLLDLDCGRYQGGWGRITYAAKQLNEYRPSTYAKNDISGLPKWDAKEDFPKYEGSHDWLHSLEENGVFYSYPLDLDLMLLEAYPAAYGVTTATPSETIKKAVLGKVPVNPDGLGTARLELFDEYHNQFQLGSKPASHLAAMAEFKDDDSVLLFEMPDPLFRLLEAVREKLESIPE